MGPGEAVAQEGAGWDLGCSASGWSQGGVGDIQVQTQLWLQPGSLRGMSEVGEMDPGSAGEWLDTMGSEGFSTLNNSMAL